jgi:site-specific DNA-methyltransferase (adenine-specific)
VRIAEIHRVLKSTGSFYLHCDPTASHYLKLVIDAVFCPKGGEFRNEIIWCYTGGGRSQEDFARKHDSIFRYAKGKQVVFNADAIRVDYKLDASKYTSPKAWGSHKGCEKTYAPNPLGKIPEDWWQLSPINSQSKERLGYPTQKPEALLERIIKASSNEGDVVLDAFCGCGTTVAVAEKLNRRWIGIDITYQSISLILKRLEKQFGRDFTQDVIDKDTQQIKLPATLELNGVPKDMDSAIALANRQDDRTRKEFEKWVILTYSKNRAIINEKKGGDTGIDGIVYILESKTENSKVLFSVKSGEKLTPAVVRELFGTVEREKAACGILLTLYPMPNLVKESKQYGFYHNHFTGNDYPKIQVVSVAEMLQGNLLELPNVMKVLKDAEQHAEQSQLNLDPSD